MLRRSLFAFALALATALPAWAQGSGKTQVLWLGQSTTRITTPGGTVIVIDPWLTTNPKTPEAWKKLEALGHVDMILVTHAHYDHFFDAPALAKLNHAPIYNAGGLGNTIVTLGMVPAELAPRFGKGGTIRPFGPNGVKITAVHAEHSSELVWTNPATGKEETHFGGEPVGYILEMENGFRIWHMGDTSVFGDMRVIADMYKPDLVMIPIGGHFTMGPQDAGMVIRNWIRPKYAVPMHYGTFPALAGTPAEFSAALGANTSTRVITLQPGENAEF
jgi:L-ascorbate metabolism protein UlaG (beta-lactamase superfamily)